MNPYPKTWKLRALIRAAYCWKKRNEGVWFTDWDTTHLVKFVESSKYCKPILKQAQRRIAEGKTIKLP